MCVEARRYSNNQARGTFLKQVPLSAMYIDCRSGTKELLRAAFVTVLDFGPPQIGLIRV